MGEGRATSRPRLCLSCATCRRRKVRCTKEQPACNSCVRTNEECKYDKSAWMKANAQAKQNKAANNYQNSDRASKRPNTSAQEDHWTDWIGQSFEQIQSQSNLNEAFTTQPNVSKQEPHTPMHRSASNSRQSDTINDTIDTTNTSAPDVGDSYFPDASKSEIFDDFSIVSPWSSTNQESLPAGSTLLQRAIYPPRPASTVSNHQSTASLKRAETPTARLPRAQSQNKKSTQGAQSPIDNQDASVRVDNRQGRAESGKQNRPSPGHFSVRDEARGWYVGAAFWGYVKNCVSLTMPTLLIALTIAYGIGTPL